MSMIYTLQIRPMPLSVTVYFLRDKARPLYVLDPMGPDWTAGLECVLGT